MARTARDRGRPSIAIATFVRLTVIKQRTGWGYETLVREVSDSLHLRRFLLDRDRSARAGRVDDPQARPQVGSERGGVDHHDGDLQGPARTRFRARAARIDSTVVRADIRYPADAMLALQGERALAREGRKLTAMIKGKSVRVRDRSRSVGRAVRAITKMLARRTGQANVQVQALK